MKDSMWLFFVVGAFLSWGSYVPVLHEGQTALGAGKGPGPGALRAFLCVGLAYFATAVVVPLIVMIVNGEPMAMNSRGFTFSFAGGALGALGALCIIFALKSGGSPMYVPPLVFAGAPIVNSTVTLWAASASAPRQLAQTRTGADGRFALNVTTTPGQDVSLYLVAAGGTVCTCSKIVCGARM